MLAGDSFPGEGSFEGDALEFDLLARLPGATDEPPRLLVLNACQSLAGADTLLQTVPTVIAMCDSIDDGSAVVFATYAGIASAQSVASALEQAQVAMEAASLQGAHLPEARAHEDVDLKNLVLVKPSSTTWAAWVVTSRARARQSPGKPAPKRRPETGPRRAAPSLIRPLASVNADQVRANVVGPP